MRCPNCGNRMRSHERSGVTVEECKGCRGVYLDRGELERLIDAETGFYAADRHAASFRSTCSRRTSEESDSDDESTPLPKRRGFLGHFFD